jgi:hypothetical protein
LPDLASVIMWPQNDSGRRAIQQRMLHLLGMAFIQIRVHFAV